MTECKFRNGSYGYIYTISKQKNIADPITLKGGHVSVYLNNVVLRLDIIKCDFVTFPKNLQEMFPNLTHFFIKNCNLEHIGTKHIGKLKKLRKFWVMNCQLRRLEGDLFSGLEKLEQVDLSGNQIEEIEPEIIDDLKRMRRVNFRNNTNINMWYSPDVHDSCRLDDLIQVIRVKCKPLDRIAVVQQESQELQRDMQTLHNENAALKQTLQDHEEATKMQLQHLKKTIEKLREKNACLSEQLKLSSDFAINVGESIFKVNKAIFMARSPFIADLLKNNPETNELTLKDVKESTFKAVHDFINTNQLPDNADHLEVFTAAAKLKMEDLKKEAAAYLLANMDEPRLGGAGCEQQI
jgi:predicted nuclease with TOPRIM domain